MRQTTVKNEKTTMRSLVITLVLFAMALPAFAQDVSRVAPGIAPVLPQARPEVPDTQTYRTINGEVLVLERDYFVVKERSGAEVRLPFNPDVPGERGLRVGDKVLAQVRSEEHTSELQS